MENQFGNTPRPHVDRDPLDLVPVIKKLTLIIEYLLQKHDSGADSEWSDYRTDYCEKMVQDIKKEFGIDSTTYNQSGEQTVWPIVSGHNLGWASPEDPLDDDGW